MKSPILLPILLLLSLPRCASDDPRPEEKALSPGGPTIRVLLSKASSRAAARLSTRAPYEATVEGSGETFAAGSRLDRSQPARGGALERPLRIRSSDGAVLVDGVRYAGELLLCPTSEGVLLVLETDLETYLPGVLAGETSSAFSPAALRAQAVASRTYALHRSAHSPADRPWNVTDDTASQVFIGRPDSPEPAFDRAAAATRGMVLFWAGKPLPAYFHSTCGGHTAAGTEAFREPLIPPLVGVACDYCKKSRYYRWEADFKPDEAASRLGMSGSLRAARLGPRTRSGRAGTITFETTGARTFPAADARMALGADRLFSTRIESLELTSGRLRVRGSGWGHGVGMCQMGAWGMALAGAGASDILSQYYPGAQLIRLY